MGSGHVHTEPAEADTAEGPEEMAVRWLVRQDFIFRSLRSEHGAMQFVK